MTMRKDPKPVAPCLDAILAEIGQTGFCVIPDLIPPDDIALLDEEVSKRFLDTPFCEGGFYGERTKRFGRLLIRAPAVKMLAEHPGVLAIARALLEPFCDTIQLNVIQAIEIHPGEIAQFPHRDEDMWQGEKGCVEYLLNVMWPLTPFTADNGATIVWPGSHSAGANAGHSAEPGIAVSCRPGGAILFLGSTLHGGGANRSAAPRRGIVVGYSLGWLKPFENPWLSYPPEVARTFSPDLTALIGYQQHRPNLGNVDGQCPSRLLTHEPADHVPAIDALTREQQATVAAHVARERGKTVAISP
jgi:ectoine hydroxylase-related dioxygenase (phytanoyl-CoA dioxygenase family)